MRALVVGGDGKIGAALRQYLAASGHDVFYTTRRVDKRDAFYVDLLQPIPEMPRSIDAVYLVAAVPSLIECERNPATWIINVDAPYAIANQMAARNAFPVFVSSDAVESAGGTAYGRQKAHAETLMHMLMAAIVRPTRVTPERLPSLCELLMRVGERRLPGVHRWS
jgi:nucleoside-diphosphate-sugar epimerase